ncbi:MAG: RnfABCDGE type electron transport complex subunit B [Clostridia bacterium]|nr:RnfABCDGE type electron transport complex subunit B [Clostridia bacterium]
MGAIFTPVVLVVVIGLILSVILTIASKVFFVPVDETVTKLVEELPGANCGACGFAGCNDYAEAMAADHSLSTSMCPVGGAAVAAKLAEVLGVEAGSAEKKVAVVHCNGNCDARGSILELQGITTCEGAKQFYGGVSACSHGCLGFGDCEAVCDFDAIHVCNGVAVVDREKCVSCGKCEKVCPNDVITIAPEKNKVIVQCKSTEKAKDTMKACKNGCIGCGKCVKVCKFEAIKVENNVAFIDPELCKNCGLCAKECPVGAINNMRAKRKPAAPKEAAEA